MITTQQRDFFETFGYIVLRGALQDDIGWITDEFEAAWRARPDLVHDMRKTLSYPEVISTSTPKYMTLFELPVMVEALDALHGEEWSHYGGDGNFYVGDTGWHSDCGPDQWEAKSITRHIKVAFYLDPLAPTTGGLRVIPGSHLHGDRFSDLMERKRHDLGVDGRDLPCMALSTTPGDLVMFDHRLKHAAYGGGNRRRMFTLNTFGPCRDEREREAAMTILRHYRDREKVDWRYWTTKKVSWPEHLSRHLTTLADLAQVVIGEVEEVKA